MLWDLLSLLRGPWELCKRRCLTKPFKSFFQVRIFMVTCMSDQHLWWQKQISKISLSAFKKVGGKKAQSCRQQTDKSTNKNSQLYQCCDLPAFGAFRTNFTVAINCTQSDALQTVVNVQVCGVSATAKSEKWWIYNSAVAVHPSYFGKQYTPTTSAAHFVYKAVFGASVWQTALFSAPDKFTSTLSTFLGIWQSSHSWQESEEQLSCCISRLASCCAQGMMKFETMEDKAPLSNWTFNRNKNVTENSFQEKKDSWFPSPL